MMSAAGLVVMLWDEVGLDVSGRLASEASFVRVLEELRAQVPVLLLCGGKSIRAEADHIRVAPLGFIPGFAAWLRSPARFSAAIHRLLNSELENVGAAVPILLVDVSIANYLAMKTLPHRKLFLYLRGDDAREAIIRQRGAARIAGTLHALVLRSIRRRMLKRLPLVGAGAAPLPRRVLAGHTVWPFYPSSLTRAEIDAVMRGTASAADRNPVRIVWIGRLVAIKRVDRLIRAAAGFARSWQSVVELHLFGDGPLRQELELLASRTGSSLETVFHGRVPGGGLVTRLQGALCLAVTSAWEGFPKVVPEALSAGIPIVAFDIGSISSLIEARDVGIVVRGGETAMAGAFQALAASPETWRVKSANARAAALDLALDDQCQRLLQHLQASAA